MNDGRKGNHEGKKDDEINGRTEAERGEDTPFALSSLPVISAHPITLPEILAQTL
jgi:hypothetical protein